MVKAVKTNTVIEDKIAQDLTIEKKILASIFDAGKKQKADLLISKILPKYFYYENNKILFEALRELSDQNAGRFEPVIIINFLEKKNLLSKVGGETYIWEIATDETEAVMFEILFKIFYNTFCSRELSKVGKKLISESNTDKSPEVLKAEAEDLIVSLGIQDNDENLRPLSESASVCIKNIQDTLIHKSAKKTVKTYFKTLDKVVGGFLPSQYIVIAARPGCGKTAFAINIICNNILEENKQKKYNSKTEQKRIVIFDQEMSSEEIADRILARLTQINKKDIALSSNVNAMRNYQAALSLINESKVFVDDTAGITPDQIAAKCRQLKRQEGQLDLVIIDYLQLLSSDGDNKNKNRQQEVAEISRKMKIMAKSLQVPVIVLSQLSRDIDKRENAKKTGSAPENPKLSDLRDSGAIEQDADIVMFLYNVKSSDEDNKDDTREIRLAIAKHRNGELKDINFTFRGSTMTFSERDFPMVSSISTQATQQEDNESSFQDIPLTDVDEYNQYPEAIDIGDEALAMTDEELYGKQNSNEITSDFIDDLERNL